MRLPSEELWEDIIVTFTLFQINIGLILYQTFQEVSLNQLIFLSSGWLFFILGLVGNYYDPLDYVTLFSYVTGSLVSIVSNINSDYWISHCFILFVLGSKLIEFNYLPKHRWSNLFFLLFVLQINRLILIFKTSSSISIGINGIIWGSTLVIRYFSPNTFQNRIYPDIWLGSELLFILIVTYYNWKIVWTFVDSLIIHLTLSSLINFKIGLIQDKL